MRNIRKRGLAIGLSLMLGMTGSLGVNSILCTAAEAKDVIEESSQKAAAGGVDILDYEKNPSAVKFVVSDEAGFEKLANLVNSGTDNFKGKTITLTADLKYDKSVENNHKVIGDRDHAFDGIFDGTFHTISGINLNSDLKYLGLFGYIGSNAKVSKLILENSSIILQCTSSSTFHSVGGIVSFNDGLIEKCISGKSVEIIGINRDSNTYSKNIGGIAGENDNKISGCINLSTVKGCHRVGGIAGYSFLALFEKCINYGTLYLSNASAGFVGGITGSGGREEFHECCNMGKIVSEESLTTGEMNCGGIVGTGTKAVNCYNAGNITAGADNGAGGIIGTWWANSTFPKGIQNSYSVGEVKNGFSGAIVCGFKTSPGNLSNCYWLKGTSSTGVWDKNHDTSSVFEYSQSQMQAQAFVDELNANSKAAGYGEVWAPDTENINNGYPVLKNVPYKISDLTENSEDDENHTETDEPLDTTPAAHFYEDHNYAKQATNSTIQVYANGGTVAVPGTTEKKNYKRCILYTDILPSYIYTVSPNGAIKASSGKVVVGITATNQKPALVKGKIVDKSVSKIASATIKSGQITVTAKTQPGKVYLWAIDTGRAAETACIPVTVKAVPSATNIYAVPDTDPSFVYESTKQFKSGKANIGESVKVYLYPFYKDNGAVQKVKNVSYTATVAEKSAEYFSVSQSGGNPLCFEIRAKGLNNGKSVTGTVTFTCNLSGKKTTFRATAVNPVTRISTANASGLTRVSDTSFRVKASDAAKITGMFELRTVCSSDKDAMTDNLKIYAMGSADGYDKAQLKEGKVKITGKRSSEQGKISMKPAKDKKTVTVTVAKGAKPVTSYFLVVYNTVDSGSKKGYTVLSVTAE